MKSFQITIKDSHGTTVYSGMFRNSMAALSDAVERLTELSKVTVKRCA